MKLIKKSFYLLLILTFTAVDVPNPAKGFFSVRFGTTFPTILENVINLLLSFAALLGIFFLIIGGYQYLTSGANEAFATQGKKTLTNAIIGLVIIILSYTIISIVFSQLA